MNSTGHFIASFIKSVIRIAACVAAIFFIQDTYISIFCLAFGFGFAEVVGMIEEIVDKR